MCARKLTGSVGERSFLSGKTAGAVSCAVSCVGSVGSQGTGELQEEQHEKTQSGLLCQLIGAILARTFRAFGSVCELWLNHGKTIGKPSENGGLMGFSG